MGNSKKNGAKNTKKEQIVENAENAIENANIEQQPNNSEESVVNDTNPNDSEKSEKKVKIDAKYVEKVKQMFESTKKVVIEKYGEDSDDYKNFVEVGEKSIAALNEKVANEGKEKEIASLKRAMKKAISEENFDEVQRINDKIDRINHPEKYVENKQDEQPSDGKDAEQPTTEE